MGKRYYDACGNPIANGLSDERNLVLQGLYNRIIKSHVNLKMMSRDMIVSVIIEQPAPRFYIAPQRAKWLILYYYRHKDKLPMSGNKKKMIEDLVENYERLCKEFPNTDKEKIYEYVVEQPAKSFYMSHRNIRDVIFNYTGRQNRRR